MLLFVDQPVDIIYIYIVYSYDHLSYSFRLVDNVLMFALVMSAWIFWRKGEGGSIIAWRGKNAVEFDVVV